MEHGHAVAPEHARGRGQRQRFADRVQAMSGGRIQIKLFAANELVPPFEVLDAVQSGTADIAHSTPYYYVGKAPVLNYFTGVPFGFTAPGARRLDVFRRRPRPLARGL